MDSKNKNRVTKQSEPDDSNLETTSRQGGESSELLKMHPADQAIYCLRNAVEFGEIPQMHFGELAATIVKLARNNHEFSDLLGSLMITERQTDIVRNLRDQVIGDAEFLVLDIGANEGWFIEIFLDSTFCGKLVAIEPLSRNQAVLGEFANRDSRVEIINAAVGDREAPMELNVCENLTGLSSLLPVVENYHFFNKDFQQQHSRELVECITLDSLIQHRTDLAQHENIALKIDTQGYEFHVLTGARELLQSGRVKAILIEMMTSEKYAGAHTYESLIPELSSYGFRIYDLLPFYREIDMVFQRQPKGQLTEFDCLMVHESFYESHFESGSAPRRQPYRTSA